MAAKLLEQDPDIEQRNLIKHSLGTLYGGAVTTWLGTVPALITRRTWLLLPRWLGHRESRTIYPAICAEFYRVDCYRNAILLSRYGASSRHPTSSSSRTRRSHQLFSSSYLRGPTRACICQCNCEGGYEVEPCGSGRLVSLKEFDECSS